MVPSAWLVNILWFSLGQTSILLKRVRVVTQAIVHTRTTQASLSVLDVGEENIKQGSGDVANLPFVCSMVNDPGGPIYTQIPWETDTTIRGLLRGALRGKGFMLGSNEGRVYVVDNDKHPLPLICTRGFFASRRNPYGTRIYFHGFRWVRVSSMVPPRLEYTWYVELCLNIFFF